MTAIKRRLIRVAQRDVHLLTAGKGSPLLLVHGSPNTSSTLRPLIEFLSKDFLIVAPDTPGNGESSPLADELCTPAGFVDALVELLDALGISRVGAYGFHSGAVFVAELGRLYPHRVSALVCEGLPLWTESEARRFDSAFFQSYAPNHDASHLTRLWTRIIDQNWYFPWHLGDKGQPVDFDLNDIDRLHLRAMELLAAGDAYQAPYRAALQADGIERLTALGVPSLVLCQSQDVLARHMRRVPRRRHIKKEQFDRYRALYQKAREWFSEHAAPVVECSFRQGSNRFVDLPGGQVFVKGGAAPTLWLHDAGESSRAAPATSTSFDLPGHGLTDLACPQDPQDLPAVLRQVFEVLHADPEAPGILGAGLGYQLANIFSGQQVQLRQLECDAPDIAPRWDGGHLTAAWHFCRFRSQYRRWDRRTPQGRLHGPLPAPEELHARMLDLLRAGDKTLRCLLPYSIAYPA